MEGELADYADDGVGLLAYHNEVASSDDEAGDPAATLRADGRLQGGRGVAGLVRARQGTMGNESFIEGFVRGEMDREGDVPAQPAAPRGGGPPHGQHAFARPCARWYGAPRARDDAAADDAEDGAAAAEPPSDASLKARIDMHAAMVARGGDDVAELARRTHAGAPLLPLCVRACPMMSQFAQAPAASSTSCRPLGGARMWCEPTARFYSRVS